MNQWPLGYEKSTHNLSAVESINHMLTFGSNLSLLETFLLSLRHIEHAVFFGLTAGSLS